MSAVVLGLACVTVATAFVPVSVPLGGNTQVVRSSTFDSWSLSHLGYLYPGTTPVMIKLDHNRSCPWV